MEVRAAQLVRGVRHKIVPKRQGAVDLRKVAVETLCQIGDMLQRRLKLGEHRGGICGRALQKPPHVVHLAHHRHGEARQPSALKDIEDDGQRDHAYAVKQQRMADDFNGIAQPQDHARGDTLGGVHHKR